MAATRALHSRHHPNHACTRMHVDVCRTSRALAHHTHHSLGVRSQVARTWGHSILLRMRICPLCRTRRARSSSQGMRARCSRHLSNEARRHTRRDGYHKLRGLNNPPAAERWLVRLQRCQKRHWRRGSANMLSVRRRGHAAPARTRILLEVEASDGVRRHMTPSQRSKLSCLPCWKFDQQPRQSARPHPHLQLPFCCLHWQPLHVA